MRHPKCLVLVIVIFFSLLSSSGAQNLWNNLDSGPFDVGFKIIETADYSRTFQGHDYRPVRIYLWYPAESNNNSLNFGDFVSMAIGDFHSGREVDVASLSEVAELPVARGKNENSWKNLVSEKTRSMRDAKIIEGDIPLVIFGQGLYYESPLTHLILCEYLASNGYIVATSPLVGTKSRVVNLDNNDLETQVRDLEFVLSYCKSNLNISLGKIAAAGFDLGGMSALLLSMRNSSIRAFVTADAGILYPHPSGLPASHPSYNENSFTIPWMHLTRTAAYYTGDEAGVKNSLFERKKYSDNYLILFDSVPHVNFTSYSFYGMENPVPAYWQSASSIKSEVYGIVCQKMKGFLDAYIHGDNRALKYIKEKPAEEKVNYTLKIREGEPPVPQFSEFMDSIEKEGFESALYKFKNELGMELLRKVIGENELNFLAYKYLYFWINRELAGKLFLLNVSLYPESANVYDSLGEYYYLVGNFEQAKKNYSRSFELNPNNSNAKTMLDQLK